MSVSSLSYCGSTSARADEKAAQSPWKLKQRQLADGSASPSSCCGTCSARFPFLHGFLSWIRPDISAVAEASLPSTGDGLSCGTSTLTGAASGTVGSSGTGDGLSCGTSTLTGAASGPVGSGGTLIRVVGPISLAGGGLSDSTSPFDRTVSCAAGSGLPCGRSSLTGATLGEAGDGSAGTCRSCSTVPCIAMFSCWFGCAHCPVPTSPACGITLKLRQRAVSAPRPSHLTLKTKALKY